MANIFISYISEDYSDLEQCIKFLSRWTKLSANEVVDNLAQADVVLILVSANYLASQGTIKNQFEEVLQRQSKGEIELIPIILSACQWEDTPIKQFSVLPVKYKTIHDYNDPPRAWGSIVVSIKTIIEKSVVIKNRSKDFTSLTDRNETSSGSINILSHLVNNLIDSSDNILGSFNTRVDEVLNVEGVMSHNIPKKMHHLQIHKVVVIIGTSIEVIKKRLEDIQKSKTSSGIKMAAEMSVEFHPSPYFDITPINETKQIMEIDYPTEWHFDITPLQMGKYDLTFIITRYLSNGSKQIVFDEEVNITTQKSDVDSVFISQPLDFKSPDMNIENIREFLAKDNIAQALDALAKLVNDKADSDLSNSVTLLQGRLARLSSDENKGTIEWSNALLERRQVAAAILNLLDDIDLQANKNSLNNKRPFIF